VGVRVRQDSPAWSPRADKFAYITLNSIFAQAVETGEIEGLLGAPAISRSFRHPDFSPDGRLLVYSFWNGKTDWNIWAVSLADDRQPFPLVQAPGVQDDPKVSPDGQWLAYHTRESGRSEVRVRALRAGSVTWQLSTEGGT